VASGLELGEASGMTPEPATYYRHGLPAEIISHAVWLYHVFSLSLRHAELILAERGVLVTHESIRGWCGKFGAEFAKRLRGRRPRPGDMWHLDEVFIWINGELRYLWRAVDQHGVVLDILVQGRRNAAAAKRFFKRLLQGLRYKPRRLITDGLRSYGVAQRPGRESTSRHPHRDGWMLATQAFGRSACYAPGRRSWPTRVGRSLFRKHAEKSQPRRRDLRPGGSPSGLAHG
jgi:putative transposase